MIVGARNAEHHVVAGVDVWVDGVAAGGTASLARAWVSDGAKAVADWPGEWALVGRRGGEMFGQTDAFEGRSLFTDGASFGSTPEYLAELRTLPIDPVGLNEQLTGRITHPTRTLVQGIRRVPGGWGGPPSKIEPLWHPRSVGGERDEVRLRSVVESVIRESVRRHGARPITTAVSGGLDSSVLVGVLRSNGADVHTVSNRFEGWDADEGPWIAQVVEPGRHTDVDSRRLDPLEIFDVLPPPGFPPVLVNHHLNLALLRQARGPLWTGFGGDEVIGHGLELVKWLGATGRPIRAAWEAAWLALRFRHVQMHLAGSARLWGGRWWAGVRGRVDRMTLEGTRVRTMTHPLVARSRAEQRRMARALGTCIVSPLLDPRIAQAALAVDLKRLVRRGRTRDVFRRACADILPVGIRKRTDKADLSRSLDEGLRGRDLNLRFDLLEDHRAPADIDALREAFDAGDHNAGCDLFRLVGASRWLSWHTGGAE